MTHQDTLQGFIFENINIRGQIAHLGPSFTTILEQHHYPKPIQQLLGETLIAATLLTASIKFKGNLTIQFQSDDALKLLVAKCDDQFHVRGLAQYDHEAVINWNKKPEELLNKGQLVITIQADELGATPYQSIIQLEDTSIAANLEAYFARSEQIPTKIWMATEDKAIAGLLLQLLPEESSKNREEFWRHAMTLADTVSNKELLELDNITLLKRLFANEDVRIFDPQPVSFRCTCNLPRMKNAVAMLGEKEAQDLLRKHQQIVVTCEFCNRSFAFDKVDVTAIFHKKD